MRTSLACLALCLIAADWPQFLGPTRDGVAAELFTPSWPESGPPLLWSHPVGAGWAGPVVAAGKVYIFHRQGDQEIVECLDANSGKAQWKYGYRTRYIDQFGFDEGPRATPLLTSDAIITFGADGDLHCLERASGKVRWKVATQSTYNIPQSFFGTACSPIQVENLVLLNVGAKGASIVAFDIQTGKEVWKVGDDAASYSSPTRAMIGGQDRIVFFTRQGLVGVDPKKGTIVFSTKWRPRLEASVNAATPLVWKDQIFVSTSYQTGGLLVQAKNDTLSEVWSNDDAMSNHYNTAVRVAGHLYGIHGRQEERPALHCVDWATGVVKWEKKRFGCAALIHVGDSLLAVAESGDVVALAANAAEYREIARAKILQSPVRAVPALADRVLFARDGKQLVAVRVGPVAKD